MADPIVEQPTPPASVANTEPAPISLSESGNPVGESSPTVEPAQIHEPIPTGDSSSGVSEKTPQIITSPALPDVKISEDSDPDKSVPISIGGTFTDTSPAPEPGIKFTNLNSQAPQSQAPVSTQVDSPGIAFKDTTPPPPETTIAPEVPAPTPEVPSAPMQAGLFGRLKGLFGK